MLKKLMLSFIGDPPGLTLLFSECFHRIRAFRLRSIYPKLINLQNKRTYCTTCNIFKAKLLLTTKNSHINK